MRKMITTLTVIAVIVLCVFAQINLFNIIPLLGVTANIGIILIVGIGLMSGTFIGAISGAFYGLIIDIVFSKAIGINILLYTLVGTITGHISNGFSKDNKVSMAMVVLFTTVLFETASYILISFIQNSSVNIFKMVLIIMLETSYNIIITLIFHKPIIGLGEMINKCKTSYYLL